MRDQITEVNGRPYFPQLREHNGTNTTASYPDGAFWLKIYPPLAGRKLLMRDSQVVCPWSIAAELEDTRTPATRRQNILEALKKGLKTIRQYELPACRIVFAENHNTHQISVWVD